MQASGLQAAIGNDDEPDLGRLSARTWRPAILHVCRGSGAVLRHRHELARSQAAAVAGSSPSSKPVRHGRSAIPSSALQHAGRHGSGIDVRLRLEPLLIKYASTSCSPATTISTSASSRRGHHLLRVRLRRTAAQRRPGTIGPDGRRLRPGSDLHARRDRRDELFFETFTRTGVTVDAGSVRRAAGRSGT